LLNHKIASPDQGKPLAKITAPFFQSLNKIPMSLTLTLQERHEQVMSALVHKLEPAGQNLICHLESLYHTKYLNYWDYAQLNQLLSLQNPRTTYPDEMIFIVYHQITELYFKLMLHELEQLTGNDTPGPKIFHEKIERVNRYLENLTHSFDIMLQGLDREQFMSFRKALVPASGFQSLQFRLIELYATSLENLSDLSREGRPYRKSASVKELYQTIYWKQGAKDVNTGKRDMSLVDFENHYDAALMCKLKKLRNNNLCMVLQRLECESEQYEKIILSMRKFDNLMNVKWKLAHFKTAIKHLQVNDKTERSTGGSNWTQYLPPKFQRVIFFPKLWSAREKEEWGKNFIEELICKQ
jgi:tryptophan 2,3-dioxygenase